MGSTIVRQWHLLTLLPRGPRCIDTATLAERLRARGLAVHRRTIQRDLVELGAIFPIVADERSKPYGWRWADDAELRCAFPALPGTPRAGAEIDLVLHALRVVQVSAVADGSSSRLWLFGFLDALVGLAPAHLRSAVAEKAGGIVSVYDDER